MREIKFRVYDKENKNIYPVGGYFFEEEGLGDFDLAQTNKRYTLMQFTGLHDKNGKEIYEGDIIKCDIDNGIDEVVWKRRVSCFSTKKPPVDGVKDGLISLGILDMEKYTVVGNIYENPELL